MNLNINQKCQLIVSGNWDVANFNSNNQDKIELLVYDDDYSIYKIEKNRSSETLVWDLEKDGRYLYFQINLRKDIDTVDITNPNSIIAHLESPTNSTDYIAKEIFSICKLRNCTIQLEKESIHNFIKNPCTKTKDQFHRDILLIAIFVLENLIAQERYAEASMIVDSLSSCGTLCKSESKTCNCNG